MMIAPSPTLQSWAMWLMAMTRQPAPTSVHPSARVARWIVTYSRTTVLAPILTPEGVPSLNFKSCGRPQDLKFKEGTPSGVRIGAKTVVREYVTIHRATRADGWTDVGEGCLIMAMSHIAHDCKVGQGAIIINYAGITGHCEIGERSE